MKVAIIGGGIGGLSLALALHQRGIACEVFEGVPEVREVGVGITLLPQAGVAMVHIGRTFFPIPRDEAPRLEAFLSPAVPA